MGTTLIKKKPKPIKFKNEADDILTSEFKGVIESVKQIKPKPKSKPKPNKFKKQFKSETSSNQINNEKIQRILELKSQLYESIGGNGETDEILREGAKIAPPPGLGGDGKYLVGNETELNIEKEKRAFRENYERLYVEDDIVKSKKEV